MSCRLCLEHKVLRKSHIVPEFLHGPLYDEKHRLIVISTDIHTKTRTLQKGVREKLFCHECEQKISAWESYAASIWPPDTSRADDYDNALVLRGVNYHKFKLFQLSLIWRASVSKLKYFKDINLGQPHQEIIRYMLFNEIAGQYFDYGCMIIYSPKYGEKSKQSILADTLQPFDKFRRFLLILQGWFWIYPISEGNEAFPFRACFLQTDGTLPIMKEDRMHEDWLRGYIGELGSKGKLNGI